MAPIHQDVGMGVPDAGTGVTALTSPQDLETLLDTLGLFRALINASTMSDIDGRVSAWRHERDRSLHYARRLAGTSIIGTAVLVIAVLLMPGFPGCGQLTLTLNGFMIGALLILVLFFTFALAATLRGRRSFRALHDGSLDRGCMHDIDSLLVREGLSLSLLASVAAMDRRVLDFLGCFRDSDESDENPKCAGVLVAAARWLIAHREEIDSVQPSHSVVRAFDASPPLVGDASLTAFRRYCRFQVFRERLNDKGSYAAREYLQKQSIAPMFFPLFERDPDRLVAWVEACDAEFRAGRLTPELAASLLEHHV